MIFLEYRLNRSNLRNQTEISGTRLRFLRSCHRVARVIALSRLARASFKFLFREGETTLRKIKGAITRNRCNTVSFCKGEEEGLGDTGEGEVETANALAAATSRNYEVAGGTRRVAP